MQLVWTWLVMGRNAIHRACGLVNIKSLKGSSLRSCPSFDDCHLKVVFASSTISFNCFVLRVLNGGDAQNMNSFSDSKSNSKASLASLRQVLWSCHKHPLGVKLNSVSRAPFSKSQTFCFAISCHFHIQVCVGVKRLCN